jgi:hypothetical protein
LKTRCQFEIRRKTRVSGAWRTRGANPYGTLKRGKPKSGHARAVSQQPGIRGQGFKSSWAPTGEIGVDENALEKLFQLEPEREPEPCAHGQPALAEGWLELITEVEQCAVCFEVVAIRLAPDPRGRLLPLTRSAAKSAGSSTPHRSGRPRSRSLSGASRPDARRPRSTSGGERRSPSVRRAGNAMARRRPGAFGLGPRHPAEEGAPLSPHLLHLNRP